MTIWLAVVAGAVLGFVLARSDFCFHSTWRRVFGADPDGRLAWAYVVLIVVSVPVVQLLLRADVIDPYIPPFAPAAAIGGGLVFGVGMVIAQTCVSGMFYKAGMGMVGMIVAIASWAVGDIITWRGPLKGLRSRLNENASTTTLGDLPVWGSLLLIAWIVAVLAFAWRRAEAHGGNARFDRPSVLIGVATAGALALGWLLVAVHGTDYSFGTAGVPSQLYEEVASGEGGSMWIPLALVSITLGALISTRFGSTLWVRGETGTRYAQLATGGLVMGVGAAIAGGCNLGHGMVGVSLLSVGSMVTTAAIIAGVWIGHHAVAALTRR